MIPFGHCQCGCGELAPISPVSHAAKGYVKGEPRRFIAGHNAKAKLDNYLIENRGYETPCWVWQGAPVGNGGYASVFINGERHRVHRYLYEREHGPIPEGLELDHLCRVPMCVRPSHVEPVTHTENMRRSSRTKLTVDQVREIRRSTDSSAVVAIRFGIAAGTVREIRRRDTWADVA